MHEVIELTEIAAGLNPLSWRILGFIESRECISYKDIRKELNISQEKLSKEISRLEGGVLIRSKRDEFDLRLISFSLTDHGQTILRYKK